MNHIYKVIWSKVKNSYVVVSETAKRNGKSASVGSGAGKKLAAALTVIALTMGTAGMAGAANNTAGSGSGVALGSRSSASNASGVAIGAGATVNTTDGVALGNNSVANVTAREIGYLPSYMSMGRDEIFLPAWRSSADAVSVGVQTAGQAATVTRQIVGVAAGTQDTDAANIAQLKKLDTKIEKHRVHYFAVNTSDTNNTENINAIGNDSMAIGPSARAGYDRTLAIGKSAVAAADDAVALGANSRANVSALMRGYVPTSVTMTEDEKTSPTWRATMGAVSIGITAEDDTGAITTATGTRQIVGLAAGTQDTDAVNVAQLKALGSVVDANKIKYVSIKQKSGGAADNENNDGATGDDAVAIGVFASATGANSTALGVKSEATAANAIALGDFAAAKGIGSAAVGDYAAAESHGAIAVGSEAKATGMQSIALGDEAKGTGYQATALGGEAAASGINALAVGFGSNAKGQFGSAFGGAAAADGNFATAVGYGANAAEKSATALGENSTASIEGGVALGSYSKTNVNSGVLGYDPSDKITTQEILLGDNKDTYDNLQTEIATAQGNVSDLATQIIDLQNEYDTADDTRRTEIINEIKSLNTQFLSARSDLQNKVSAANKLVSVWQATGAAVSVGDSETGLTRQITNVAAGTNDTDAVNVAQLTSLSDKVDANKISYFSVNSTKTGNQNNTGATGSNSIAVGPNASVTGSESIAIGNDVTVNGYRAIGIGSSLGSLGDVGKAEGSFATSIGYLSSIDKKSAYGTALGAQSRIAASPDATVVGAHAQIDNSRMASAFGQNVSIFNSNFSVAVGSMTSVDGSDNAIVVGTGEKIRQSIEASKNGILIGSGDSMIYGSEGGIAIGNTSKVDTSKGSISIGDKATNFFSPFGVALGAGTVVGAEGAVALGADSTAYIAKGVVGYNPGSKALTDAEKESIAWKSTMGAVSIGVTTGTGSTTGTRQIVGVAAGTKDTDAVNVAQLTSLSDKVDANKISYVSINTKRDANKDNDQAGIPNDKSSRDAAVIGSNTITSGLGNWNLIVTGFGNTIKNITYDAETDSTTEKLVHNTYVYGNENTASNGIAIGRRNEITGGNDFNNIAIGFKNKSYGERSVNMGISTLTNGVDSIAVGFSAKAPVTDAIAVGSAAEANGVGSIAFGSGAVARVDRGVALGYKSLANRARGSIGYFTTLGSTERAAIAEKLGKTAEYNQLVATIDSYSDLAAKETQYRSYISERQKNEDLLNAEKANLSKYAEGSAAYNASLTKIKEYQQKIKENNDGENSLSSIVSTSNPDYKKLTQARTALKNMFAAYMSTDSAISVGNPREGIYRQITGVAAGSEDTDAVNVAQLKDVASAGLNFKGDGDTIVHRDLADTLNITGGKTDTDGLTEGNIGVVADETTGTLNVKLAKSLTGLSNVKVGDEVTLGASGLTITGGPSVTTTGIDAGSKKITNVAAGTDDNDAVNMSQLKDLSTKVDAGAVHYFSVNADDSENPSDTNWNNDGATGKNSIAIGRNASTIGSGSIAIGDGAKIFNVNPQYALVIGEKAESAHGSIVIGRKAKDYDTDPKEAGSGVYIGEEAKSFGGVAQVVLGNYGQVKGQGSVALGNWAKALAFQSSAVGEDAKALGVGASAFGADSIAEFDNSTALGAYTNARGYQSMAAGRTSVAAGNNSIAIGYQSFAHNGYIDRDAYNALSAEEKEKYFEASGLNAYFLKDTSDGTDWRKIGETYLNTAVGAYSRAYKQGATFGGMTSAQEKGTAIGTYAKANAKGAASLGYWARGNVENGVALGAYSVADREKGKIGYALGGDNSTLESVLESAGQKARYDELTNIIDPLKDEYNGLVDAYYNAAAGSAEQTAAKQNLDSWVAEHSDFFPAVKEKRQMIDAWQSGSGAVSVGSAGATRQITNVAAGSEDTDAVNVAQLKAVGSAGLNFKGDGDTIVHRDLADTLNITGGKTDTDGLTEGNIGVVADETTGTLNVKLAKELKGLSSVQVGDKVTLDASGLTVTGGPSVTTTGINAGNQKITGVAKGEADTDAVNMSQLKDLDTKVNTNKISYVSVNSTVNGNKNNDGAKGTNSVAIGGAAKADSNYAVAMGGYTSAKGERAVAIGYQANSNGGSAIALGNRSSATGATSLALGSTATAANGGIALGLSSKATASSTMALGQDASATAYLALALGNYASASANTSMAFGYLAKANNNSSTAIGSRAQTNGIYSVAIGDRAYVGEVGSADGSSNDPSVPNQRRVTVGEERMMNPLDYDKYSFSMALGTDAKGYGYQTTAIGGGAEAYDTNTLAIGFTSKAKGHFSNAVGGGAQTDGKYATAVGYRAYAGEESALALGDNAYATIANGVALGSGSKTNIDKGVLGYDPSGKITSQDTLLGDNKATYDSLQTDIATAQSTVDTLSQAVIDLQSEKNGIDRTDKAALADVNERITAKEKELADARTALQDKISESNKLISTWQATGAAVSVGNSETGLTRQITGVAAGTEDTDAVNVAQLKANKVTVTAGTNVTLDTKNETDGSTTYTVNAIDTKVTGGSASYGTDGKGTITLNTDANGTKGTVEVSGLTDTYTKSGTYDKDSKKIKFTQNDTDKNYEVDMSGLVDGITDTIDKGLNFAGDSGDVINKKLDDTLKITGGVTDKDKLTEDNIGVVSDNGALKIKLAKDLQGLSSVKVGNAVTLDTKGLIITNGPSVTTAGINAGSKVITNVADGVNANDAVNVGQLDKVKQEVTANKVVGSDNITVTKLEDGTGTKISLNDEITLGDKDATNVAVNGKTGTITAGDGAGNQVAIDGTKSTITAGTGDNQVTVDGGNATITAGTGANQVTVDGSNATITAGGGENKVTVDGNKGLITVGGAISIGNQTVTPKKTDDKGNVTDGTAEEGKFITGLTNTEWDPEGKGIVENRAATEGQLKDISDTVKGITDTIGVGTRDFMGDETGDDKKVGLKLGESLNLKGGADTTKLSTGNIGVVTNKDKNGFDIKLAEDLKGLKSIETNTITVKEKATIGNVSIENNKVTVGNGDNATTITNDSVKTGNTTMNNDGVKIGDTTLTESGLTIKDGPSVTKDGINTNGKKITGIAAGDVTADSTDAINGSQLYNTNQTINNLGNTVNQLGGRVDKVGASSAALAALHPLEFDPEDKWNFAAGFGHYKSESSAALGAFYRMNENTLFSVGGTFGGERMWNAGVSVKLGSGTSTIAGSRTAMAKEIQDLKTVVADQNEKIEEQNKKIEQLMAAVEALTK